MVGLIGLAWLAPWLRWMPRGPGLVTVEQKEKTPTILEILKQRSAWGPFIGLFCNAYSLYFLIAWLPFYLVRNAISRWMQWPRLAVPFLTKLCARRCAAALRRWIAVGASRTRVHITFMIVGMLGTGGFLLASLLAGPILFLGLLLLVARRVV